MEESFEDFDKLKKDSFKVPDNYFTVNRKDLLAIAEAEGLPKKVTIIPLWKRGYVWSAAVAAAVAIGLFIFYPPQDDNNLGSGDDIISAVISDQSMDIEELLIEEYVYGYDESLLLEEVEFEDLDQN